MFHDLDSREKMVWAALLVAGGVLLFLGWRSFWFLTDDAYISFRYVSNRILGHGFEWNPPPFRPVEGYTNFLWLVLLEVVWRLFRVSPPVSSNYLSLGFSLLALIVASAMALQLRWRAILRPYRLVFLGLLLVGVTTNRTFLTWSSSGLETAMFNFLLLVWVYGCLFVPPSNKWWVFWVTSSTACIYLTRPDGLIFLAATAAILYPEFRRESRSAAGRPWLGAAPLLAVLVHLAWRRATYGEWLPNTYYAKFAGLWPESGVRYALSFVLEYALWVWVALALLALAKQHGLRAAGEGRRSEKDASLKPPGPIVLIAVSALVIHLGYYTFVIGGDHFEYRVYSHLIPLAFVSFAWLLNRVDLGAAASAGLFLLFVLLSWPIPWTHRALTRHLETRQETFKMRVAVAAHWPPYARWYARLFDDLQFWLIDHFVCARHQEHKINCEHLKNSFPSRKEGLSLPDADYPILRFPAVGVASWVLPRINIIDVHGINDYAIARNPRDLDRGRRMAHDRKPPKGYVECFRPNVQLLPDRKIEISERTRKLRAKDIRDCERIWSAK